MHEPSYSDGRGLPRRRGGAYVTAKLYKPRRRVLRTFLTVERRRVRDHTDSRGVAQRQSDWSFKLKTTGFPV
ncbi:hypothetical protein PDJAM_G00237950 [Pangasius djambal]|uniref:Uncharacterized protein n=1 Tax=Pangasius djambal TaxID=1691987 RepID=A0ACC5YHX4_9TELE|nr:hypothetical protein [Pangasius djambal]